jgi:intein-encoded DNA endonuclease-like protein
MKSKNIELSKEASLGYIAGTVMGDGWFGYYGKGNYVIGLCVKDKDFAETFFTAVKDIGLRPRFVLCNDFYHLTVNSKQLHDYLANTDNKFILKQSEIFKRTFLRGLFDSDGWVTSKIYNPHNAARQIGLANNNKDLIELVQTMLSELEIKFNTTGRIHSGFGSKKIQYELKITGKYNFRKFQETINFSILRKQNTLNELLNSFRTKIKCSDCRNVVQLSDHQPAIKYCEECSIRRTKLYKRKYRRTEKAKEYDKRYMRKWREVNREKYNTYMKKYHRKYRTLNIT